MTETFPESAIEVRETFTASEPLKSAVVDLLDPRLGEDTRTRFGASFLFQSYRRRLKTRADLTLGALEHKSQIVTADQSMMQIPHLANRISLEDPVRENRVGYPYSWIVFRASSTEPNRLPISRMNHILSQISSVEEETLKQTLERRFFVRINDDMIDPDVNKKLANLTQQLTFGTQATTMYIEPAGIIMRSAPIPRPPTA